MSATYENMPVKPLRQMRPAKYTCDACGGNATDRPGANNVRQPTACLWRIQDDGMGNTDEWRLDLCSSCKKMVMKTLDAIARAHRRKLPNKAEDVYPPLFGKATREAGD